MVWVVLEMICFYLFCKAFLTQRRNDLNTLITLLIAGTVFLCVTNLNIQPFVEYPILQNCAAISICLIVSFVAFKGRWYNHVVVITLYYLALGIMDTLIAYGTAAILNISVSELIWRKWLYTAVVALGKCILIFLAWSIFYLRSRSKNRSINNKRLLLIFVFPLVSIIMLYTVFDSYKSQGDLSVSAVIFSFILILSNAVIIYLLNSIERAERAEQELALLNQSMALQSQNIRALEKSYRAQRKATHEFKHQLQVIYELLSNENTAHAKEYIRQLQKTQSSRIFAVNTKHPIVDAILNEKYHEAKESDIDISFKVNDLSALTVSNDALVVLLSNLMDNAIEACRKLTVNRAIECTLLMGDDLFLSIRNTSPPVEIKNGTIETTKEPKREHGFGLAGVRRIINQLGGDFVFDYSDGWFQFTTDIPVQQN